MSLKRETLIEAGVTDKDKIDTIMQAYGAGIESAKAQVKADTTAEIDSLKEQLQAQTDRVTSLLEENKADADVKTTLEQLQTEYDNFKTESENKLAQVNKNNAIALSLKDVNAYDTFVF